LIHHHGCGWLGLLRRHEFGQCGIFDRQNEAESNSGKHCAASYLCNQTRAKCEVCENLNHADFMVGAAHIRLFRAINIYSCVIDGFAAALS
jgi:hypothetical protein